jgi:hypothetical protein
MNGQEGPAFKGLRDRLVPRDGWILRGSGAVGVAIDCVGDFARRQLRTQEGVYLRLGPTEDLQLSYLNRLNRSAVVRERIAVTIGSEGENRAVLSSD